jgi:hypothetical protein
MVLPDTSATVIYVNNKGEAVEVTKPLGRMDNANFLIRIRGKDWSGFMPLDKCLTEFMRLIERRPLDQFTIVER